MGRVKKLNFYYWIVGYAPMKLFKSLLGKKDKETPQWDIRPPADRPAARRSQVQPATKQELAQASSRKSPGIATAPAKPKKEEPHPFMDDPMLDTLSLEVDTLSNVDDPYSTHSWNSGVEGDTRKLKTVQIGEATDKHNAADFNPYDTGKMRRSWKD